MKNNNDIIFIHIPKTGGVTITSALMEIEGYKHYDHNFAKVIKDRIGDEKYKNAFKFAMVRNPWDRLVSVYYFLKVGSEHLNTPPESYILDVMKVGNFKDFVRKLYDTYEGGNKIYVPEKINLHSTISTILRVMPKSTQKSLIFNQFVEKLYKVCIPEKIKNPHRASLYTFNQTNWVVDDNNNEVIVDYIGKFHEFNDSIEKISGLTSIPEIYQKIVTKGKKKNYTKHGHYRDEYDDETKEMVAEMYKEDINIFKFNFNNE